MNIDEMPAGPEMNELMAIEVMGWYREGSDWWRYSYRETEYLRSAKNEWMAYADDIFREPAWSPYDHIADAWKVVEHILVHDKRLLQFRAEIVCGGKYQYAKFVDCGDNLAPVYGACAASMPLAICRAALKVARSNQHTGLRPSLTTAILSSLPGALQGKLEDFT